MFKKAFTLAEVMMTLTVIGIITAVIVPIAVHSRPDENIIKFKKAHNTLYETVHTLATSDKYYKNGDFAIKKDGTLAGKSTFCNSFADLLSTKKTVCDYTTTDTKAYVGSCEIVDNPNICNYFNNWMAMRKANFDNGCNNAEQAYSGTDIGVLTTDNVYYFEMNLRNFFGCKYKGTSNSCLDNYDFPMWQNRYVDKSIFGYGDGSLQSTPDYVNVEGRPDLRFYRVFCIDIDGINKGEGPFGYGIRADGKIINGIRADEWLAKSITGED